MSGTPNRITTNKVAPLGVNVQRFVMPSDRVTEDMIKRARVDDDWHFAANLNAMMKHGYCKICGMVPSGCKREGCEA